MKTINDFFNDIATNEKLKKSFEQIESTGDLCKKAKKLGYNFTEDQLIENYLTDVSGGGDFVSADHISATINQTMTGGNNNIMINYGDAEASKGEAPSEKKDQPKVTPEQKLQVVFWALNR